MPSLTRAVAEQYDRFQASLEALAKPEKYLNYGFTRTGHESYEARQQQLCLEVFRAADIRPHHHVVDVGFGSGEQDFLLLDTWAFDRLVGFNISERQVVYATTRAAARRVADRLVFRLGEAEELPGVDEASIDRMLAIECAFYFDRPRFYQRAAAVLARGGRLVLADIAFADGMAWLARRREDFRRVGTQSANRAEWERYFRTLSVTDISRATRPGAQMTVARILRSAGRPTLAGERGAWLKMAYYSQLVAIGLALGVMHYDLIVLEKL